jgi:hypothetical protein
MAETYHLICPPLWAIGTPRLVIWQATCLAVDDNRCRPALLHRRFDGSQRIATPDCAGGASTWTTCLIMVFLFDPDRLVSGSSEVAFSMMLVPGLQRIHVSILMRPRPMNSVSFCFTQPNWIALIVINVLSSGLELAD